MRLSADSFEDFIESLRTQAESKIKAELSKRSFLERVGFSLFTPFTVSVIADRHRATLMVLGDGSVRSEVGVLVPRPDIIVEGEFSTLKRLFATREKEAFLRAEAEGKVKVTPVSWKGERAHSALRESLGG